MLIQTKLAISQCRDNFSIVLVSYSRNKYLLSTSNCMFKYYSGPKEQGIINNTRLQMMVGNIHKSHYAKREGVGDFGIQQHTPCWLRPNQGRFPNLIQNQLWSIMVIHFTIYRQSLVKNHLVKTFQVIILLIFLWSTAKEPSI